MQIERTRREVLIEKRQKKKEGKKERRKEARLFLARVDSFVECVGNYVYILFCTYITRLYLYQRKNRVISSLYYFILHVLALFSGVTINRRI